MDNLINIWINLAISENKIFRVVLFILNFFLEEG
jgi:hypothetical protein